MKSETDFLMYQTADGRTRINCIMNRFRDQWKYNRNDLRWCMSFLLTTSGKQNYVIDILKGIVFTWYVTLPKNFDGTDPIECVLYGKEIM